MGNLVKQILGKHIDSMSDDQLNILCHGMDIDRIFHVRMTEFERWCPGLLESDSFKLLFENTDVQDLPLLVDFYTIQRFSDKGDDPYVVKQLDMLVHENKMNEFSEHNKRITWVREELSEKREWAQNLVLVNSKRLTLTELMLRFKKKHLDTPAYNVSLEDFLCGRLNLTMNDLIAIVKLLNISPELFDDVPIDDFSKLGSIVNLPGLYEALRSPHQEIFTSSVVKLSNAINRVIGDYTLNPLGKKKLIDGCVLFRCTPEQDYYHHIHSPSTDIDL